MALGIWNETIHRYVGEEKSIVAHGKAFVAERMDPDTNEKAKVEIPDSIGIVAEMKNGATAVYHASSVACVGAGPELLAYGTKGAFRLAEGKAWVAKDGENSWSLLEVPDEKKGGWRVEEEFVEAIREGKPVTRTSFDDGIHYMEFMEAIQRSLKEGKKIELASL